ncbi:glutathione S-transferase family protein [Roseibium hamelinense]|uniref:glutathione S-transferase family protein n=1 Tax=Roseibium hamelinense TaxID=150831 RepID=UPI00119D23FF|nr:glutathione S-transferase family protein [Roseibium hamelinense]MTI44007.1 glutathione S-transferase family protein [Roseibium hamelinense]
MYKLIGFPQTRAMRVMWMLEELGEPYEIDPALPQSEAAKAINPSGKVPALCDGDLIVTESVAICTYLADKHGKFTFPAGTPARAQQDSITQFAVDVLEGALWTSAKNTFVNPESKRVPEIKDVCRYEFGQGLKTLEHRLGDGRYAMGEQFTVPDIILGHCSGWAKVANFELPSEGTVYDYFKRLRSRDGYKATTTKVKAAL